MSSGFPEASRRTSTSFHFTPAAHPVPSALNAASFAAKRAAKWMAGSAQALQYAISVSVYIRLRKRGPNREIDSRMRSFWIMSMPSPVIMEMRAWGTRR